LIFLFIMPGFCQTEDADNPYEDACRDAEENISGLRWFGCGLIGCILGIGAAYLVPISTPGYRLIGKTSEYTRAYTHYYKQKARDIRLKNAGCGATISTVVGCIVGTIALQSIDMKEVNCSGGIPF
jgi:hypothetical protein